jgi:hypothetical protein
LRYVVSQNQRKLEKYLSPKIGGNFSRTFSWNQRKLSSKSIGGIPPSPRSRRRR